jgi:ribosomal protein L11 methyltransferase
MAFGTGTHATTKLCLQALEEALRRKKRTVLDVGTGSGILAIAAAKAGAREVVAIDVDPVALNAARDNVRTNEVADRVRVRMGSVGKVLKEFDVVVANIDLKSLRRMRRPLFRHLKPGGILILSGILRQNEEDLRQFYLEFEGLKPIKTAWEGEWSCLTFRKKPKRPNL